MIATLINGNRTEVRVAAYGGTVLSVRTRDLRGEFRDITLGHPSPADYQSDRWFLGPLIGRYANRIAGGRFALDGRTYHLPANDPPNHLHGGPEGFHRVLWTMESRAVPGGGGLVLTHQSPDGASGYPGTLDVRVEVTLTAHDELAFDYLATTDRATPVNLTQHSYWNLKGHGDGDILGHQLTIRASRFLPVDPRQIPTGELRPVEGTPFDFRAPTAIGSRFQHPDTQLRDGYDHTWVLDGHPGELRSAAKLHEPESGRTLEVLTTEPGLQMYTGNGFAKLDGKDGKTYHAHAGIALETQHFPDSPNQPSFPSTILRPHEEFRSRTVYRFGIGR